MNDLISRKAVLEKAVEVPGYISKMVSSYDIATAPAVEAEPVKHGRWVHVPSSDMMTGKAYKCSECNKMRYGSFMPNYCQICGAKMDGKSNVPRADAEIDFDYEAED